MGNAITWKDCCFASLLARVGLAPSPEGAGHDCPRCGSYHRVVDGRWLAGYRCPRCRQVSLGPHDRERRYCRACHQPEEGR